MTVLEIINIAKVSQYLSQGAVANGGLFSPKINPLLPIQLYVERKAVEWRYTYEGIADAVLPTSLITIDALIGLDTRYLFEYDDPDFGMITLADYTESVTDTTIDILANSIYTALIANSYGFTYSILANVITQTAPERIASQANNTAVTCTITALSMVLTTVSTPSVNAAPSSADNIMYILKVENQTAITQTVTNLLTYVRGVHIAGDFFSLDVYYNTSATLSGSVFLSSAAPIDSNLTQYNVAFSQDIDAADMAFFILVLSVNATPVAGRTGYIDGSVDPVELTITATPIQVNSQSNLSGVVTIT